MLFDYVLPPFRVVGSSPTWGVIKETSLVYQGKRGFFLHFGQKSGKYRQNRAFRRWINCPEACFFISDSKNGQKCWCTFCVSLLCKEIQKGTGWVDLNLFLQRKRSKNIEISQIRLIFGNLYGIIYFVLFYSNPHSMQEGFQCLPVIKNYGISLLIGI